MLLSIPLDRAPLKQYENSPHLQKIRERELIESLKSRGVEIVGGGPGVVQVSLRNLAIANRSAAQGRIELVRILEELNADAVTVEPADLAYLAGGENVFNHAIARGLESDSPGLAKILTDIPIDPDGSGVPLF
jgi:hypothetical protein